MALAWRRKGHLLPHSPDPSQLPGGLMGERSFRNSLAISRSAPHGTSIVRLFERMTEITYERWGGVPL